MPIHNGDELHLIIESDLIKPEQEIGFLFTVLQDMSKPKLIKPKPVIDSNQIASLSILFDVKES